MKKGFSQIILASLCLVFSLNANAQFNIGTGFMFNNYNAGDYYKKMHSGLQLRIGYDFNHALAFISTGINYSPTVGKTTFYLPFPSGDEYYYTLNRRVSNAFFHVGMKLFPTDNDFNIRIFGGSSADIVKSGFTYGDSVSKVIEINDKDSTTVGYKFDLGASVEFKFGRARMFAEYVRGISGTKVDPKVPLITTFNHTGIIIGFIYCFENRRNYW